MSGLALVSEIQADGSILAVLSCRKSGPYDEAVLCFSMPAPVKVLSGGAVNRRLASYCEIRLEGTLTPSSPQRLNLAFLDPSFKAGNRAWWPQSPYLRTPDNHLFPVEWDDRGAEAVHWPSMPQDRIPECGDALRLVPPPKQWIAGTGVVEVDGFAAEGNDAFVAALYHADALACRVGQPPLLRAGGLPLIIEHTASLDAEAYRLDISAESCRLSAATDTGVFRAATTLLSLRSTYGGRLPLGVIDDAPRFSWRGLMLDCARHYYSPATLYRVLDLMALLKLSRFHWHFADDEAFRLEVDCYPALWQRTRVRGEGQLIPGVFSGGMGPTGGSYAKQTVKEIVAYAKALHIEVIPEVETPAHSYAMVQALPELRDPDDQSSAVSVQGYEHNTLNPAREQTWTVLSNLIEETATLFPYEAIHIGGDEVANGNWLKSPQIASSSEYQNADTQTIAAKTLSRVAQMVQNNNRRACAWEEAVENQTHAVPKSTIVFAWTKPAQGVKAARLGYDVVMCPAEYCYFDMTHSADPNDWGATWSTPIDLLTAANWDPLPDDGQDIAPKLLGVQANYWSEYITRDEQLEPMLMPRLLATASRAWSPAEAARGEEIVELYRAYVPLLRAINWSPKASQGV